MSAVAERIAFIGLGQMGGAIAERLMSSGSALCVCDRDEAKLAPFISRGAERVATPAEAADKARIVFACLPSPEASCEVAFGSNGVAFGSLVETYVEMSTVGPAAVRATAQHLAQRKIAVLDAPVSGGPNAVRDGTLNIMVSGPDGSYNEVRHLLEAVGGRVVRLGVQPGLAQTCKLVNNALSLVGMALAAEAVVLGVKAGLDPDALIDVINTSTGRNSATLDKFPRAVLTRSFDYGGPLEAAVKDLGLFLAEASRMSVPAPITEAGARVWEAAARQGDPRRDFTTIVQMSEAAAGVEVAGAAARLSRKVENVH